MTPLGERLSATACERSGQREGAKAPSLPFRPPTLEGGKVGRILALEKTMDNFTGEMFADFNAYQARVENTAIPYAEADDGEKEDFLADYDPRHDNRSDNMYDD